MKEAELQRWWPDIGTVVAELRRIERSDVADPLLDAVMADVNRAYPGGRLEHWLTRVTRRLTGGPGRPSGP